MQNTTLLDGYFCFAIFVGHWWNKNVKYLVGFKSPKKMEGVAV